MRSIESRREAIRRTAAGKCVEPFRPLDHADVALDERHAEQLLKRVEQLLGVPLIQSNVSVVQWSDWFAAFSDKRAPDRFTLRFDRAHMSFDAAAQGLGVALESTTTGSKHLAEGKLRPVLGMDKSIRVKAHFAVYPVRHAKRPPVEAFLSWLHGEAARSPSLAASSKAA